MDSLNVVSFKRALNVCNKDTNCDAYSCGNVTLLLGVLNGQIILSNFDQVCWELGGTYKGMFTYQSDENVSAMYQWLTNRINSGI